MAKPKKLPSGNWRVRVYSHTTPDGKKHYESFTASTKDEAKMLGAQFSNNRHTSKNIFDLTIEAAIDKYIESKTNVLSPSTIRGYRQLQKTYYNDIGKIKVKKITSVELQYFISSLSTKLSPKTIKNIYGLLTSSIALFAPDKHFNVTLPMKSVSVSESPSDEQIMALYNEAEIWLKKCIALGAFGGLRRGEIASLKFKDMQDGQLYIHSDFALDENNNWIYKEMPKTTTSVRMVRLPQKVMDLLGSGRANDYIVGYNPDKISKGFRRLKKKLGINIRFHDLRHFYASTGVVLGIPDIYMADFGGWRHDSPVLKGVYQGNIKSISYGYSDQLAKHFDDMIS